MASRYRPTSVTRSLPYCEEDRLTEDESPEKTRAARPPQEEKNIPKTGDLDGHTA